MKRFLLGALLLAAVAQPLSAQTLLRQSTERTVRVCGAVAVGDGFTPVTTLALSTADEAEALREGTATLDISGATWAAVTGADGCYTLTLSTTATSTVGELIILVQDDSLVLPLKRTFQVVEEAVFDACCVADAAPLTADAVADAVLDEDLTAHQTSGTLGAAIGDGDAGAGMTEAGGDGDHLTEAGGTGDQFTAIPQGEQIAVGTCDSGSTTTCVDAVLTQSDDDYWKGVGIRFTSGSIVGQTACVIDFAQGTDTLTFRPATTQAVSTNTYKLFEAPNCHGVVAP